MPERITEASSIETAEQYQARLNSYIGEKDPIAMQRDTPRVLAGLIEGVPDDVLRRRPAPRKWSVRSILAHMAEDELVSSLALPADDRAQR